MKLISFEQNGSNRIGAIENGFIYDFHSIDSNISDSMLGFLQGGEVQMNLANKAIDGGKTSIPIDSVKLLSPLSNPPSVRDAYAFRQHVATARKNRGLEMIPEFDEIPIFYFTNHNAVFGPGNFPVLKRHTEKLDFELECAAIIGKGGRNISVSEADNYITGFMIMNDFCWNNLIFTIFTVKGIRRFNRSRFQCGGHRYNFICRARLIGIRNCPVGKSGNIITPVFIGIKIWNRCHS